LVLLRRIDAVQANAHIAEPEGVAVDDACHAGKHSASALGDDARRDEHEQDTDTGETHEPDPFDATLPHLVRQEYGVGAAEHRWRVRL
jgi:hypothetical protein